MESVILGLGAKQPDVNDELNDDEEYENGSDLCSTATLLTQPSSNNSNNTITTATPSSTTATNNLIERLRRKISLAYYNHEVHYPVYTGSTREKFCAEFVVFLIWFGLSLPALAYIAWVSWVSWHRWAWMLRVLGSVRALPALARGSDLAAAVGGDGGNESGRVGAAIAGAFSAMRSSAIPPGVS